MLVRGIPDAAFVPLDSRNHVPLEHESAWQELQDAVAEFTGVGRASPSDLTSGLTRRERETFRLLCDGRSNAAIGHELHISEKTVRNHVSSIYAKLGVRSRAEAAADIRPRTRRPQPSRIWFADGGTTDATQARLSNRWPSGSTTRNERVHSTARRRKRHCES
jgi:DNA-binding CsgD family transcriptional regulator